MSVTTVETVEFDHPDAVLLRDAAVVDLGVRYGGDEDAQEVIDPATVVATVVVRVDGVAAAVGSVRDVSGEDDGRGHGTVHPPATGEVKRVFVAPGLRRNGLARTVMEVLESEARDAGLSRLVLETGTAQPEAIAMYERLGYEPIEKYGRYAAYEQQRSFGKDL